MTLLQWEEHLRFGGGRNERIIEKIMHGCVHLSEREHENWKAMAWKRPPNKYIYTYKYNLSLFLTHTQTHRKHFAVHTHFLKFLLFCIANMHFMCLPICISMMSVNSWIEIYYIRNGRQTSEVLKKKNRTNVCHIFYTT